MSHVTCVLEQHHLTAVSSAVLNSRTGFAIVCLEVLTEGFAALETLDRLWTERVETQL